MDRTIETSRDEVHTGPTHVRRVTVSATGAAQYEVEVVLVRGDRQRIDLVLENEFADAFGVALIQEANLSTTLSDQEIARHQRRPAGPSACDELPF